MLVHLIADFGRGDLAFAEVAQRIKFYLPQAEIIPTVVPAFSTLAAGFCVAQLGLGDAPEGTLVFHNVAPRKDDGGERRDNDGERLAYIQLPTGVQVVGVNAGHAFSFVRDLAELRYVNVPSHGSQFRSRDLFPRAFAAVVNGAEDALAEKVASEHIPDVPESVIMYVDGFGNLKTTLQFQDWTPGTRLQVTVGEVCYEATVTDGSFGVAQGELAFSPGSSGWVDSEGKRLRWVELFLRGGSAWQAFGRPAVGARVGLEKLSNQ